MGRQKRPLAPGDGRRLQTVRYAFYPHYPAARQIYRRAPTGCACPLALLAYEAEETHTLAWGQEKLGHPKRLRVYIGPAGGWTDEEVVIASQYNVLPVTLGVNILRAETACIAAAAKLL